MIAKATLWLCLSLLVAALVVALVSALCGWWPWLKFALAVAAFFGTAARMILPSVEAYNNDRDWADLGRHPRI